MNDETVKTLDARAVTIEPLALPIDDAAVAAGVTRTRLYEALRGNELTARKPGKATIIDGARAAALDSIVADTRQNPRRPRSSLTLNDNAPTMRGQKVWPRNPCRDGGAKRFQ